MTTPAKPSAAPAPNLALSVVVPVYNEALRIERGLRGILGYLEPLGVLAEVIVVDDGSTDGTRAMAASLLAASPVRSRMLANEHNRGKGFSVRRGMLAAAGARVLFTDIDLSTPMADLPRLEAALEAGADVAIGSRDIAESKILRHQAWYRELAGKCFNGAVQLIAVRGIQDTQCGFKLFRRAAVPAIFERQTVERWGFDVEVLLIARRLGYRIAEVPVHWTNDTATKVHMLKDGFGMLLDVVRVRARHRGLGRTP